MRFITKNVLAVVSERNTTIDWLNHYMTLPLAQPMAVRPGDVLSGTMTVREARHPDWRHFLHV